MQHPFFGFPTSRLLVSALLLSLLASGCTTERPFAFDSTRQGQIFIDGDFASLSKRYYLQEGSASSRQVAAADRKEARNAIIRRLMLLDDEYFSRYCNGLYTGRAVADTAAETINAGITSAATFITPGNATRALTAIASGLSGLKLSVDKNLFLQQTAPALVAKMQAQRSIVDTHMQQFMQADVATYPLEEGLRDFVKYFQAGTLLSAASGLSADATVEHEEANQQLQTTKLRRSTVQEIILPSRGINLKKVQPPGSSSGSFFQDPLPEGPDGEGPGSRLDGGGSHGAGKPAPKPTGPPLDPALQTRKDTLGQAFKSLKEDRATTLLPPGVFAPPGGAIERLAKSVLIELDRPIIEDTAVHSLAKYREALTTDEEIKKFETVYRKFKLIP